MIADIGMRGWRPNGAADGIRCLFGATRRATTRVKPTPDGKTFDFLAHRSLSAAPLGEIDLNKGRRGKWLPPGIGQSEPACQGHMADNRVFERFCRMKQEYRGKA